MDIYGAMNKKLGRILSIYSLLFLLAALVIGCGGPRQPLTLTVSQPIDGATITQSSYQVRGTVSDSKATVMVNDVKASMTPKGFFGANLTLTPGENTITIVAKRNAETVTQTLKVTFSTR